jgi:hypothetical protein
VVFPDNTLTQSQKNIFTAAAHRWEQIITADVPDDELPGNIFVDDVRIEATGPAIDGVGLVLGSAGPTALRDDSLLPAAGIMHFDSADLAILESDGRLLSVITHEMSHVLGFGTIWGAGYKNLVTGVGGADPRYTGAAAVAEYQAVFGSDETTVPVANIGNPGNRDVHWRESTFGPELLTGFLDFGPVPLSRVSAASFIDLGYTGVVLSAADAFTPPLVVTNVGAAGSGGGSVVVPGSNVLLTATVSDGNGFATDVSFYRESNGTLGLQTAGGSADTLIGTDTIGSNGFTFSASTNGLLAGTYRFYARALDSDGDHSAAGTTAAFAFAGVAIAGDINLSGTVGPEDFNVLATNFGAGGKTWTSGDLSGDGTVGPEDFNLLASHFGESLPPGGAGLTASVLSGTSAALTTTTTSSATGTTRPASVTASVLTAPTKPKASAPRYHKHR